MDHLPVEVIGNILSCVGAARDVVLASATCRKWRQAFSDHLCELSFSSSHWPVYRELAPSCLEVIITQTIFQTRALQSLSILIDDIDQFSGAPVMAWLMYTRDSLRHLSFNVQTCPNVSILDKCGRHKLEELNLAHNYIGAVGSGYQKFPLLKFLSLSYVSVSALDLSLLLSACPKIEILSIVSLDILMPDVQANIELCSQTLKEIKVESISLDKFILDADILESLHLKDSTFELFEVVSKGTLKQLKIDDVSVIQLDIGESVEHLEVLDISNFTIMWPKFYQVVSKSSRLKRLRLWGIDFDDDADDMVDLETIASCFPKLTHLSLSYDLRDWFLQYTSPQGSFQLENAIVLEVGWTILTDTFGHWVASLLERCPNLKKLIICGIVSDTRTPEECSLLANFTSFIVQLMRIYINVDVQFEYE